MVRKMIVSVLILLVCLSGSAFSASDVIEPGADGVYTVGCTEGVIKGSEYMLMVVRGTQASYDVSDESVLYADKAEAGENGVRFSFLPMFDSSAVALLYGSFSGDVRSPVVLGVIANSPSFMMSAAIGRRTASPI